MKQLLTIALFFCLMPMYAQQAEEQLPDLEEMSLEELMNVPIRVSKSGLTMRETPSAISVVTRDEIKRMGARDLTDVINQIPGFSFGIDVQNVIGLGSRGNWGYEGKILILLDGQEMNEILFSTTHFGQHFDINNIERIEIIRGPGSSIYGGYAELGVINIITRRGQDIQGITAGVQYGNTNGTTARQDVNFSVGGGNDRIDYSISGYVGRGIRSDKTYTDIYGNTGNLRDYSQLNPLMLNAGLKVKNLSLRFIHDGYTHETIDQFDEIVSPTRPDNVSFKTTYAEVRYDWKASDKVTVTPRLNYKRGTPWYTGGDADFPYQITASRLYPSVNINWKPSDKVEVVAGADSYFDHAEYSGSDTDYFGELSTDNTLSFNNIGLFGQAVFKVNGANLTLGARLDNHSQFGSAFSPRIGLTKAYNKFHYKLLYSRAFRAPALENMNYNPAVKPERTGVAELELGYKVNSNVIFTGNFYHINISDPIVYFVDGINPFGTYDNFNKAGSLGMELDFRVKYDWGFINANYSTFTSKNLNDVPLYVDATTDDVLAMPGHRINVLSSFNLGKGFQFTPSVIWQGKRSAVTGLNPDDSYRIEKLDAEFFLNLYVRYAHKNFDGGLGVHDVFDQGQLFVQPFASGKLPVPGIGRELVARVAYTIPFKKG